MRFPMVLLRVCHRWRVIAIATPTLWTDIVILASNEDHLLDLDAARLYVERSGSRPISLIWKHRRWNQHPVIQSVFLPAAPRLKNITILTVGSNVRDSLLVILEAISFPILEWLRCDADWETSLATVNIRAPHLRHGVFIDYMIPAGTFSSLVALEIILSRLMRQFDAAAFFDLLHNIAQTLKYLRLRTPNRALKNYTPSTLNIQLPELVVLDLRSASELLLFVSTPNLHTLCLEGYIGDTVSPFTSFDAPMLTRLQLEKVPLFDLETVPDFPWRFQELETVILRQCSSAQSFFCHAASNRHGVPAFPSLHSIIFSDPNVFPSIRSMVEGWKVANPSRPTLKRIRFICAGNLVVNDVEWITAQGIEFSRDPDTGESWITTPFRHAHH